MNEDERIDPKEQAQLDRSVSRGQRAKDILDDPLMREALETMRQETVNRWRRHDSPEAREEEWRYLRLVDAFEAHLLRVMRGGEAARARLDRMRAAARRVREAMRGSRRA